MKVLWILFGVSLLCLFWVTFFMIKQVWQPRNNKEMIAKFYNFNIRYKFDFTDHTNQRGFTNVNSTSMDPTKTPMNDINNIDINNNLSENKEHSKENNNKNKNNKIIKNDCEIVMCDVATDLSIKDNIEQSIKNSESFYDNTCEIIDNNVEVVYKNQTK